MNTPRPAVAAAFAACLIACLGGCKQAAPPPAGQSAPKPVSAMDTAMFGIDAKDEGEALFGRECAFCHVGKTTGAFMLGRRLGKENADLTKRTDLQGDYVKAVVRNGLVNMPAFSRVEVTEPELDKIAAYLSRKKN
ncbi:cytochrome c [Sphingomonas sp. AR_OL41]|uniref:c-type cytochrome n=1 Tax=Sphingomonas sp. AR_OL41 TaxID=3042729 RepID=UPI002480599F|nr:cytochrome c [Sphingomonas sp. AR_OL41]MDH7973653.1 cytochrome c [Sphingomonas sp. AR_OL41]